MANGHIILDTRVDTAGINKGFTQIKNAGRGIIPSLKKIGAAVGIVFGVSELVKFGKAAIELASDVQEVQNVVDVAFGDMSDKMEAFADTAIETYGISKLTAKRTGSTYMAMATGMGVASEQAADMALALTGLSADMASFYNKSQEYTDIALKSVFTGETETLKQYGIVMTQVNLQEFARQQGITKSMQKMTQQEQVMLRYNYIMQQTRLAHGDFIRTQDSWANQTRILSERWKEMQIVWGDAFMTIGTLILPAVNTLIKGLTVVGEYAKKAAQWIARLFGKEIKESNNTTAAISSNISAATENQDELTDSVKGTGKALNKVLAGFDELNVLSAGAGEETGTGAGAGGGAVQTAISPATSIISEDVKNNEIKWLDDFFNKFKTTFDNIKQYIIDTFGGAWKAVTEFFSNEFERLKESFGIVIDDLFGNWGPQIMSVWTEDILPILAKNLEYTIGIWEELFAGAHEIFNKIWTEAISPIMDIIVKIWSEAWAQVKNAWDTYAEPLFNGVKQAINGTKDLFMKWWNIVLKPIFDALMRTIDWLWEKHLKQLWENITNFVFELWDLILILYNNVILPVWNWFIEKFGPIISNIIQSLVERIGTIIAVITDVVNGVFEILRGLIKFLKGVFTGNWEEAWEGIKLIFKGIWDAIWGIIKGIINTIIDGLNFLWRQIYKFFKGVVDGIGGAVAWVGELFGKDWGFSMPENPPLIPKLAKGAVLPANKPFLAMLGDQKSGTNIEAPLSTIEQALRNVLTERGDIGTSGDLTVNLVMDNTTFGKVVVSAYENEKKRTGSSLIQRKVVFG